MHNVHPDADLATERTLYASKVVINRQGMKIWTQTFKPKGAPVGMVLFIHGIHEHSARYNHVCEAIADKLNMLVFSYDQRSHGKSENIRGKRGACDKFDDFLLDAEEMAKLHRQTKPTLPYFLWGQSFGGLVAASLGVHLAGFFDGIILTSPAININMTPVLRFQAKFGQLLSKLAPDARLVPAVRAKDLSKDEKAVEEYLTDPLNLSGNLRARIGCETLKAFKALHENHSKFKTKSLLVLFGDTDNCCSLKHAQEFAEGVQVDDKQVHVFPNMYHTLFHEPEKQLVTDYMIDWIRQRLTN
mmetsp:Transcript_28454/g.45846  ORF Transcript_28454/g.45846 Transcript_28454/m.45846 type:complete len:301 (+) Transcript_28454:3292-4194(+)